MSNIISFQDKLKDVRDKNDTVLQKRKQTLVQQALQCYHCAIKCEKCGMQASAPCSGQQPACQGCHAPYRFCDVCRDDYQDYIFYLKGARKSQHYWQNEVWAESWQRWIEYQGAIDRYYKSKEFNRLVNETRKNSTEQ